MTRRHTIGRKARQVRQAPCHLEGRSWSHRMLTPAARPRRGSAQSQATEVLSPTGAGLNDRNLRGWLWGGAFLPWPQAGTDISSHRAGSPLVVQRLKLCPNAEGLVRSLMRELHPMSRSQGFVCCNSRSHIPQLRASAAK